MAGAAPFGAQRLFLHVGLPKTGTTYLQSVLASNREVLREHGFVYPFVRPEAMFHAAAELRSDEQRWGLDPAVTTGTWQALLERARQAGGTAIISHEILGAATPSQIARALELAGDFEVCLVVTARDLARQVPAHWQEGVKNGQSYSFAEFRAQVAVHGLTGRDDEFWCEQDLMDAIRRWREGADLPASHVHVVTCPPGGADPTMLWGRFAAAVGLTEVPLDLGRSGRSNPSLGRTQVAVLRGINQALDDAIGWPDYAYVVKRGYAQKALVAQSRAGDRALAPADLRSELERITQEWTAEITEAGYVVHGDLADLSPMLFGDDDPDEVDALEVAAEVQRAVPELLAASEARGKPPKKRWWRRTDR